MELLNPLSVSRASALYSPNNITANCLSSDEVGKCVRITGPATGDVYQVTTAAPLDGGGTMPAVGVIIRKVSTTTCTVQVDGLVEGVFSGLTPGKVLFVSEEGGLEHTPMTPPTGWTAYIQSMGVALSTEVVLLKPNFSIIKRVA